MEIILDKKIKKGATIIEGFPGIGLVGTITTEFLIQHLKAKPVGMIVGKEIPPMVAVHDTKVVRPLAFFYDEKNNILILHVISSIPGAENQIAELLLANAKKWGVKEIISVESVGVPIELSRNHRGFYFSNRADQKFKKMGLEPLKEGIIMGVTGALMLQKEIPLTCIFAETHSRLPDSAAAAKIIEALNKYLKLNIDVKPLVASAKKFETKLRELMSKSKELVKEKDKKQLSYVG
ncbi:MAG: proteasome assembly chaperone family protein [Nanoarchaeota archaeon]|nr:proteasome assembly chaperone family protein [Nanoarchaeota archaeon]